MLLLFVGLLYAGDPDPVAPPSPGPAPVATVPAAPPPGAALGDSVPPPVGARVAGEEIDVQQGQEVLRKRAEVYAALVKEGYVRRIRKNDRTVFLSNQPWKPRVIVHDDGWVYFKRQPPRIHAPGKSFADQGSPAAYLLCIVSPLSCLSVGGWLVSPRKMGGVTSDVMDAAQDKLRGMNDAVARRELGHRLNEDIPRDLDTIWGRADLLPADRRLLLYEYWDTRTDTPEGDAAKGAVEAFLRGVVQQSDTPFTAEELAALNARRSSIQSLDLLPRAVEAP
ncbi:MAG: hypothetical protein Q8P41_02560 [Pseudomonadota bacterium]|nr:hypothetical protein [Pseudomonadota bacterium]